MTIKGEHYTFAPPPSPGNYDRVSHCTNGTAAFNFFASIFAFDGKCWWFLYQRGIHTAFVLCTACPCPPVAIHVVDRSRLFCHSLASRLRSLAKNWLIFSAVETHFELTHCCFCLCWNLRFVLSRKFNQSPAKVTKVFYWFSASDQHVYLYLDSVPVLLTLFYLFFQMVLFIPMLAFLPYLVALLLVLSIFDKKLGLREVFVQGLIKTFEVGKLWHSARTPTVYVLNWKSRLKYLYFFF